MAAFGTPFGTPFPGVFLISGVPFQFFPGVEDTQVLGGLGLFSGGPIWVPFWGLGWNFSLGSREEKGIGLDPGSFSRLGEKFHGFGPFFQKRGEFPESGSGEISAERKAGWGNLRGPSPLSPGKKGGFNF